MTNVFNKIKLFMIISNTLLTHSDVVEFVLNCSFFVHSKSCYYIYTYANNMSTLVNLKLIKSICCEYQEFGISFQESPGVAA